MASRIHFTEDFNIITNYKRKTKNVKDTIEKYRVGIPRIMAYYDFINELTQSKQPKSDQFDYFSQLSSLISQGYFQFKKEESKVREGTRLLVTVEKTTVQEIAKSIDFSLGEYLIIPV